MVACRKQASPVNDRRMLNKGIFEKAFCFPSRVHYKNVFEVCKEFGIPNNVKKRSYQTHAILTDPNKNVLLALAI